jgi:adenylate cyclase
MDRRMKTEEFAAEAGIEVDFVEQLTEIGVLKPDPDGGYGAGDLIRVEAVRAFLDAGIGFDRLKSALAEGIFTFDYLDRFHPEPQPTSGRTLGEFAASLDALPSRLGEIYLAMGLPEPAADKPMRVDEEGLIEDFLRAWDFGSDDDTYRRAARLIGEPARRVAEGWTQLYVEKVSAPLAGQPLTADERIETIVASTERLARLAPRLMLWLLNRHLRHAIDRANIDGLEQELVARGLSLPSPDRPPAIAFVDISGYTALTELHGDRLAARTAERLRELAEGAAAGHGGRVVKMLGDGAMIYFPDVPSALAGVLRLVQGLGREDLAAHAGIHAGPLIEHDGDYFGRTVNLASRVAGTAGAGEVVVTEQVATMAMEGGYSISGMSPITLKGIDRPARLFRILGAQADGAGGAA